jgi:hypothetical protein
MEGKAALSCPPPTYRVTGFRVDAACSDHRDGYENEPPSELAKPAAPTPIEWICGREPKSNRRVDIPKGNGKFRTLQIPCIRDRVVQGAVKLILEAIFEADFCPNSYGFRACSSQ